MKAGILTAVGAAGSIIASLFGGWDTALVTLIIFMGVDYLTGLIVAGVFHNSEKTASGTLGRSPQGERGLKSRPYKRDPGEPGGLEGPVPQGGIPAGGVGGLPPGPDYGV